ncbi:MAG TPA: flagellar export chaperone FliS [Candidatus Binatia bacterium]|nr:flagellar export chaperone FliS [Candidatus Binatia bacterium]
MSHPRNPAASYREAQFATADRGRLLVLMFDGGVRFLRGAEDALGAQDVERFAHQLSRAQAIIAELLHTLDHKAGGTIAADLDRLYRFMLEHLVEANLRKSVTHVAEVRRVFEIVAGAYREILAPASAEQVQLAG